jgi:thiamine-phosphate pyrophosphorylase
MDHVHRVLDANTNRAAEGMRVLEDIARFVLERRELCEALKRCRHELRQATPSMTCVWARDTECDVGTDIAIKSETSRSNLHEIAIAAGNRCAEALRVIEEMFKLDNEENTIESIRYRMYKLSSDVVRALGSHQRKQWSLCFILTTSGCILPWRETVRRAIDAGCDCVQIREKTMTTQQLVEHTKEVVDITNKDGVSVIVNDSVEVALVAGALGAHLGSEDLSIAQARQICGHHLVIGATVHCVDDAKEAVHHGADYLGIGPMFASTTKPELAPKGISLLKDVLRDYPGVHHLAIGGIDPSNTGQLFAAGCKGIAMSDAIASSTNPDDVIRDVLNGVMQPS